MEYKLLNEKKPRTPRELFKMVMENRGFISDEDIEAFMNPSNTNEFDEGGIYFGEKIEEFEKILDTIIYNGKRGKSILIIVDADADGFTSASALHIMLATAKDFKDAKIDYFVHSNKAHGLTEEVMQYIMDKNEVGEGIDLVLVPDAGSNDLDQWQELNDNFVECCIIDHHETKNTLESFDHMIINNQFEERKFHKEYVGAGMVLMLAKYAEIKAPDTFKPGLWRSLLPLFLIGQIGDSSDIASEGLRHYVLMAHENFLGHNEFLDFYVMNNMSENFSFRDFSFSLIPMINAVARIGKLEERKILFEALANYPHEETITVLRQKKDPITNKRPKVEMEVPFYDEVCKVLGRVKTRQDKLRNDNVALLDEQLDLEKGILISVTDNEKVVSLTGLIANMFSSKYKKPTLTLVDGIVDGHYIGSGRGSESVIADFKLWLNETGLFEFAEGHANAFGVKIKKENLPKLIELTKDVKQNPVEWQVDAEYNNAYEVEKHVIDICKYNNIFGGKVTDPLLCVNLSVPKKYIKRRGTVITLWSYGVSFIIYKQNEEAFDAMQNAEGEEFRCKVIGRPKLNNYQGKERAEIIVEELEFEEINTLAFGESASLEDFGF